MSSRKSIQKNDFFKRFPILCSEIRNYLHQLLFFLHFIKNSNLLSAVLSTFPPLSSVFPLVSNRHQLVLFNLHNFEMFNVYDRKHFTTANNSWLSSKANRTKLCYRKILCLYKKWNKSSTSHKGTEFRCLLIYINCYGQRQRYDQERKI